MVRVLLILGLLVLVPAVIVFWRTRERGGVHGSSQKSVRASTVGHGGAMPQNHPTGPSTSKFAPDESRRKQP